MRGPGGYGYADDVERYLASRAAMDTQQPGAPACCVVTDHHTGLIPFMIQTFVFYKDIRLDAHRFQYSEWSLPRCFFGWGLDRWLLPFFEAGYRSSRLVGLSIMLQREMRRAGGTVSPSYLEGLRIPEVWSLQHEQHKMRRHHQQHRYSGLESGTSR